MLSLFRRPQDDYIHAVKCRDAAETENERLTMAMIEAHRLIDGLEKRLRDTQTALDQYVAAVAKLAKPEIEAMRA